MTAELNSPSSYGCSLSLDLPRLRWPASGSSRSGPAAGRRGDRSAAEAPRGNRARSLQGSHSVSASGVSDSRTPKRTRLLSSCSTRHSIRARLSFETQSRELEPLLPRHQAPPEAGPRRGRQLGHHMTTGASSTSGATPALARAGFTVVRFTNEQVDADADGCVKRLIGIVRPAARGEPGRAHPRPQEL